MSKLLCCVAAVCTLGAASVAAAADRFELKGRDGDAVHGQILLCNDCQKPEESAGTPCDLGAEKGWYDGRPCGTCLIDANFGTIIGHPYDLRVVGKLVDAEGKPVPHRFVKLFMPNGWNARSRTSKDGVFRLILGATQKRAVEEPVVIDLGEQRDSQSGKDPHFALFLLPPEYKPCETGNGS